MTLAFKASLPSTAKFVLVALCDCANDQGECYPSVPTLAKKCSAGDRTIQEALALLERTGNLRREYRTGRATVYWLTPQVDEVDTNPRSSRTPAVPAPPQLAHHTPAVGAPPPPQLAHQGGAAAAPRTIIETSIEPSKKQKKVSLRAPDPAIADLVKAGFDEHTAAEFIEEKARRKAPLTARAWADHLRESAKAGWSPQQAAEKVMSKTWKGFEASYVANERGPPSQDRVSRQLSVAGYLTGALTAPPIHDVEIIRDEPRQIAQ